MPTPNPRSFMLHRALLAGVAALLVGLALLTARNAAADGGPQVGAPAPSFSLPDQTGTKHNLADYKGKWLVLYFYPKDGTPGCTTEACEFRDNIFAFRDQGVVVLGISLDDVDSHKKFATEQHLPFPLLSDASKDVARQYGVLAKFAGLMDYTKRETFVIDPQGRIAKHYVDVDPKDHSKTVLADIKALKAAAPKS